jgi:prolyl 4-hydroxylase
MSAAQPATNWASEYPQGVVPTVQPAEASGPQYMPLNLNYPGLRKVCQTPPVYVCDNFLTFDECDAFISTAGPLLQRSKTHAIAGASLLLPQQKSIFPPLRVSALNEHPCVLTDTCLSQTPPLTTLPPPCVAGSEATKGRTSLTCHLAKTTYPSPILLQKIQALTGKPFGHMELPQVARYTDSQRYVEHYDGVDPHTDAGRAFCANGGQRVATVLCYLNDVAKGGATAFRRVNFEVLPKRGMALIFFPGLMNGELNTDALHAGMPAVDVKWVSQVWVRQSFREDGQPSQPVPDSMRTLEGPLHKGYYRGHCLAGDDIREAVMTIPEAIAWASSNDRCFGFTYNSKDKEVDGPIRIWFKSRLNVLYNEVRAREASVLACWPPMPARAVPCPPILMLATTGLLTPASRHVECS